MRTFGGIPVYGGLDLSAVSGLTALVLIGWRAAGTRAELFFQRKAIEHALPDGHDADALRN